METKKRILLCVAMFFVLLISVRSQDYTKFPITKIKVSKNIMLYKTGLTSAYPNMVAVNTTEGVVVIDSHQYPEVAKKVREMISKDFNNKVIYLINSHGAYDHTGGNIVFGDVPIIGQSNIKDEISRFMSMGNNPRGLGFIEEEMINKPEKLRPDYPGDKKEIDESIESNRNLLMAFKDNSMEAVVPDTFFDDQYTLTVGNKVFEMHHNTPGYSQSDILIYIPAEKTLIVGDIFNKNRLPSINPRTDVEQWEELFAQYLSKESSVEYFVGGHGGVMTMDEIKEQLKYIRTLYDETKRIKSEGKSMDEAFKELALEDFPYLNNYNPYFYGTAMQIHNMNISAIWRQLL